MLSVIIGNKIPLSLLRYSWLRYVNGYIVYKLTNNITKLSYIGTTKRSIDYRFFSSDHYPSHFYCIFNGKKHKLYDSIRYVGLDNYTFEIINICDSSDEMYYWEKYYIKKYNTFHRGYNFSESGKGSGRKALIRYNKSKYDNLSDDEIEIHHSKCRINLEKGRSKIDKDQERIRLVNRNKNPLVKRNQQRGRQRKIISKMQDKSVERLIKYFNRSSTILKYFDNFDDFYNFVTR
ncbi:endonuclease [Yersinia phage YerA41]|nr:endonuclease [Yersinia phage YerA41]